MVIFDAITVFTHPFIHIFFLILIIFEKLLSEYFEMKKRKIFYFGTIASFFAILVPYMGLYYSMLGNPTSETWWIFQRIVSERSNIEGGFKTQPLFHLIPRIFDQAISLSTRYVMFAAIFIVTIGFLFYFIKKRKFFDLNTRLSCRHLQNEVFLRS